MRYLRLSVIILAVSLLVAPCFAQELPSVPKLIEYTGKLSRPNGSPYPVGEYQINFEICADADCTISLWSEIHPLVISNRNKKDIDGASSYEAAYSVILGSVDPINNPLNIIFDQGLYLHITEDTLGHDKTEQLTSTSSALSAEYAVKVFDSDIDNYVEIQDVVINEAKNANTVDGFHATGTLEGDKLVVYGAISTEIDNRITYHTSAHGHLSNTQKDELVTGNDTNLHYHASDRYLANSTGVLDKSHLDASQVQMRVTGACGPGYSIQKINEDGSVVCEPDDMNDAVSNPNGTYNNMRVGYASSAGSAVNVAWGSITGKPSGLDDGDDEGGDGHSLDAADSSPEDALYVNNEGNVGIGTTGPDAKLRVADGTIKIDRTTATSPGVYPVTYIEKNRLALSDETFIYDIADGWQTDKSGIHFIVRGYGNYGFTFARTNWPEVNPRADDGNLTTLMRIMGNGNVGIGTTNPGVPLEVVSSRSGWGATDTMRWRAPNKGGNISHVHWDAWGDWYIRPAHNNGHVFILKARTESDISNKEDIEDITYGLSSIMNLHPVMFRWKDTANPLKNIGLIAQEVEPIIPELVSGEEGSKGLSYNGITAVLIKAIQELKAENDTLKHEIAQIKAAIGL